MPSQALNLAYETASSDDVIEVSACEDLERAFYTAIDQELPHGYLDSSSHPPSWGNMAGLRKLEDIAELKIRISRFESRADHVSSIETRIDKLETRVAVLTLESNNFLEIRNRRFCTFRRDILHDVLARDSNIIPSGNEIAHGGDVLSDVKLYERGIRFDDDVFIKLYGLPYTRVKVYETDSIVLQTLNMHSTVIAEKRPAEDLAPVKASFSRFIRNIQDGGYRRFVYMPNTPETKAMEKFRSDHRELLKKHPWPMPNELVAGRE